MQLTVLTKQDCEIIRRERNKNIIPYRTSFLITQEMQENFYNNVICNRKSEHRYWALYGDELMGMVGLCNLSLENRNAEISIVIVEKWQRKGYGENALKLLLKEGFYNINLENIYGEAYTNNPNIGFWNSIIKKYGLYSVILPARKYYDGKPHDAVYFNFNKKIMEKM
jgi:RimJ/RimL family protein N-acetyltransferase